MASALRRGRSILRLAVCRGDPPLQRIDYRREYFKRREPAVVGFNNLPWRKVRVGLSQHVLRRRKIFGIAFMLANIVFRHSPGGRAVSAKVVKPALLFCLGDVKKEFYYHRPLICKLTLKGTDVLKGLTEALAFERFLDPVGYDPAVPASVEDGDPSASRSPFPESPQERVKRLFFGRPAGAINGEPPGIERQDQLVDEGTLARCTPALKEYDRRDFQRLCSSLQVSQLQVCFRFLGFEARFVNCPGQINILEYDYLPRSLISFDISIRRAASIPAQMQKFLRGRIR